MISVPRVIYEVMIAHAQDIYPQEACGLLAGSGSLCHAIFAVENILASPIAYEMEPRQQLEAMLAVEKSGLEMLAAYHSHPAGPPVPSATDISRAFYPELVQIIVALGRQQLWQISAFLVAHGETAEIELRIE